MGRLAREGKTVNFFFIIPTLLTPSDAIEFSYRPGSPCIALLRIAALFWRTRTVFPEARRNRKRRRRGGKKNSAFNDDERWV
jgi:hypothetical protein